MTLLKQAGLVKCGLPNASYLECDVRFARARLLSLDHCEET